MFNKHTPEPWTVNHDFGGPSFPRLVLQGRDEPTAYITADMGLDDMHRAAECVNALEGLNPEAVRDVLGALRRIESGRPSGGAPEITTLSGEEGISALLKMLAALQEEARAALILVGERRGSR